MNAMMEQARQHLSRKRNVIVSNHPAYGDALVLENADVRKLSQICGMFGCSGYMASGTTAVITNFGKY